MVEGEALKLALEALEKISKTEYHIETPPIESLEEKMRRIAYKAITAIKEALAQPEHGWTPERIAGMSRLKEAQDKRLAQPEQEPVAWYRDEDGIRIYYETKCWDDAIPLYTAPQRTWVGLTRDEILEARWHNKSSYKFARVLEARLKEKNGL